jgi:hypothetical protein
MTLRWLLVSSLGLVACGPTYEFYDSVDPELRLFPELLPSERQQDRLYTPYVAGARMQLFARDVRSRRSTDFTGWTLASSDPDVLRIESTRDDESYVSAEAIAVGEGDADLLLVDDGGSVVASVDVPVRFPTRIELLAAAAVFLDREDVPAEAHNPQVLVGGEATFLVRYYQGETQLWGNGALEIEPVAADEDGEPRDLEAWASQTGFLSEDRDWLRARPAIEGVHTLDLGVAGETVTRVVVRGVGPEAVTSVELYGWDESRADRNDPMLVIAQAYDEEAEPIYGVEYDWSFEGEPLLGDGDMFRYEFDPDRRSTLAADFEDVHTEVEVRTGEGYVDSSNNIGCSIGAGSRAPLWGLMLLGLFAYRSRSASAV